MNKNLSLLITASTLLGCGQGYDEATSAVSAVTVSGVTFVSGTGIAAEHCRLPATLLAQVGAGRQVRLVRSNPAGLALCTVDAVAATQVDGEAPRAEMDAASLRGRFSLSSGAALVVSSVTREQPARQAASRGPSRCSRPAPRRASPLPPPTCRSGAARRCPPAPTGWPTPRRTGSSRPARTTR